MSSSSLRSSALQYFDLLKDVAEDATLVRHSRHAACVVHRDRMLAIGTAKYKTHPIMTRFATNPEQVYLHAEMDAIVRCINRHGVDVLPHSDLYVLRLTKGGAVSLSRPCEVCQRAINAFGIKQVHWSV
jgi:deoxycytidylate deaminase